MNPKILFIVSVSIFASVSHSWPLSTRSRWIIDAETGNRVKLRCITWAGHLQPMIPEGLHRRPLKEIAAFVASTGFNCVRLTWATFMFTRHNYSSLTVAQSLDHLGLKEAKAGVSKFNPGVLNLTSYETQRSVVDELGKHNVMVVLDNHISLPEWCCNNDDGDGFFRDEYFDPMEWAKSLRMVAKAYKGNPTVIGMSIRNELRGPLQNEDGWYRYVRLGADTIQKENQDVLVIVSGLSYDTNLTFLKKRHFNFRSAKLVYESHWYPFGEPSDMWVNATNRFCAEKSNGFIDQSGFLLDGPNPSPLILSEFGIDERGESELDDRYFSCLMCTMAEKDIDWGLWTLQGSYMLRKGRVEEDEVYGVFDANWDKIRNITMQGRMQLIHQMLQDPNSNNATKYILFHPQSGLCASANEKGIQLRNCKNTSKWSHDGDATPIKLVGTSQCLAVDRIGHPPVLSKDCSGRKSKWQSASLSKNQMAARDERGNYQCLTSSSDSLDILMQACLCVDGNLRDWDRCTKDPTSQWFKLVPTNIGVTSSGLALFSHASKSRIRVLVSVLLFYFSNVLGEEILNILLIYLVIVPNILGHYPK